MVWNEKVNHRDDLVLSQAMYRESVHFRVHGSMRAVLCCTSFLVQKWFAFEPFFIFRAEGLSGFDFFASSMCDNLRECYMICSQSTRNPSSAKYIVGAASTYMDLHAFGYKVSCLRVQNVHGFGYKLSWIRVQTCMESGTSLHGFGCRFA